MESKSIRTFLFFDLETSGLPHLEKTPTKITELALIAVDRDEIIRVNNIGNTGEFKENTLNKNVYLPRVLSKVSLPIYPCKLIDPKASQMTGLDNAILEHKKPFDEGIYRIFINFMELLNEPICLVAHNGYRFDFPILKSELGNIKKLLRDDIYCVDSLPAFRAVLGDHLNSKNEKSDALEGIKPLSNVARADNPNHACDLVPKCGWSCEDYDNELILVAEVAEIESNKCKSFNTKELETKIQTEMDRIRKQNERTPKKIGKFKSAHTVASGSDSGSGLGCRSKLNHEQTKPTKKMAYNLKSVFENVTGKPLVESHQAEADALALLECVTVVGRPILEWMDKNKIPFKSIRKMW